MDSPIERAARALCVLAGNEPDALEPGTCPYADERQVVDGQCTNGDPGFFVWRLYVDQAVAVLTAIREPSEGMVEAGRWPAEDDGPVACWTAMIDAALSE